MSVQIAVSNAENVRNAFRRRPRSLDAGAIFATAVRDCDDILRSRGQTVSFDNGELFPVVPVESEKLSRLLSKAICDIAAVSRRGAVLSLAATGPAIVIRSRHALEIPGAGLSIDGGIRQDAREMRISVDLTWEQGNGPRMTLALPTAGTARRNAARN